MTKRRNAFGAAIAAAAIALTGFVAAPAQAAGFVGVILPDAASSARWETADRPFLQKAFDAAGLDSAKTSAGTAYTSTRTTASVADKDSFMDFVKANSEWHLLETRCSKTAVEQFKEVNGEVPPGVNWREERVVNIRRS